MDEDAAVMPQHASRSHAILYDQFEDEHRFADWGADELFTRMPRRRPRAVVDETRTPRAQRARAVVDDTRTPRAQRPRAVVDETRTPRAERQRAAQGIRTPRARVAGEGTRSPRTPRPRRSRPLELVESPADRRDAAAGNAAVALAEPPPTGLTAKAITAQPVKLPRPLPIVPSPPRRRTRSMGDWIGARPERIVAWAFLLGLLLVLIAISTADAAIA